MPKLFISYRRHDSADATGRLYDRLKAHFGEESVFYDVENIPYGIDFRKHIEKEVSQCDVLLAVVGENWVNAEDKDGQRRLDNPNDLVRVEVETALARDIPVVPVLVGNASMPAEADLPGELKGLKRRNYAIVRSGAEFEGNAEGLIRDLEQLFADKNELGERVQKVKHLGDDDPEIALLASRKVLEIAIREMYERRIGEPAGSRTLEKLTQRLHEQNAFPTGLDAAGVIQRLEGFLARVPTKKSTKAETSELLAQGMTIVKWYMTVEQPDRIGEGTFHAPKHQAGAETSAPGAQIAVVPKGLRSFDAKDADFFLDLLPGARDKHGLPESIRFWKHRIEEKDETTFTVGVIYGPSGCGKSSLVKAGLLPRLAGHVVSVYIEATADDTEARLLKVLRKRCPDLSGDLDLTRTIEALCQKQGTQKILLVIDQFEQWLHAKRSEVNTELAEALRQCDGEHVQCVVTVRDDFWMGLTRFMKELQIEFVQGQNGVPVDLFDLPHAKNVLSAFGRAFGRVSDPASNEQEAFLDQAVKGLAQDGRIISVRLALFAEMVKGKTWAPATLKEVGGTEGVGVTFLEETFSSSVASAKNRLHQNAARGVLKALLPEQGADIKGNMQSHAKLLEASGYAKRPHDFEELLRILDTELKLITGTEPEAGVATGEKYYQLTHDYLVPSLRDWLTRKQKESRRGRAELLLADRAVVWNARPENRQLPSLYQALQIRCLTAKKNWTPPQRKMMRKAGRYHAVRSTMLAVLLAVVILTGLGIRERVENKNQATHAEGQVNRLLDANIGQVPGIVAEIDGYRTWADDLLRRKFAETPDGSQQKLHASLALLMLRVDAGQKDYLYERLLDAEPQQVPIIRQALAAHQDDLTEKLWQVAEQPAKGEERRRLRAAGALAVFQPEDERWNTIRDAVADDLVTVPAVYLANWLELLRPVRGHLRDPLAVIYRDGKRREIERSLATDVLADYAGNDPEFLAGLLLDADDKQFAVIYPRLQAHGAQALALLQAEVDKKPPGEGEATTDARDRLAKQQANAAVALLRLGHAAKVWPLLEHGPDPRRRSFLIHSFGPLSADAATLIKRLENEPVKNEPDVSIRRALILSIGEMGGRNLSSAERTALIAKLKDIYATADDPGLHGAAEWTLRQFKEEKWLRKTNEEWTSNKDERDKRIERIKKDLASRAASATGLHPLNEARWYVTGHAEPKDRKQTLGHTMVVIPGPVVFKMGSPKGTTNQDDEILHDKRIGRSFAIAAKSVTVEQYRRLYPDYKFLEQYAPEAQCPVISTSWYQAAAYCYRLGEEEGIKPEQQCYETDKQGNVIKLKEKYLSKIGYRLPTEAEWEFACRADAVTSRFYGDAVGPLFGKDPFLARYAYYLDVSGGRSWPVGSLKPNDFGLFDMHGNVWNWCQERYRSYPDTNGGEANEDKEDDTLTIDGTKLRVLRGGSFNSNASDVRSAYRTNFQPDNRYIDIGFRPARTFR